MLNLRNLTDEQIWSTMPGALPNNPAAIDRLLDDVNAKPEPDKYDRAIAYLTQHPEEIQEAWMLPMTHEAGCLFKFSSPTGNIEKNLGGTENCGCLTSIKRGRQAYTPELTKAILGDDRIPNSDDEIRVSGLPVFAEWQRRLDLYFNRIPSPTIDDKGDELEASKRPARFE